MPPLRDFFYHDQSNSTRQAIDRVLEFTSTYENYFNEHFLLRPMMISLFYQLRLQVFHETVFPNVVIGKEGWLYYTGEGNLDEYQRTQPFTINQLEDIRHRLFMAKNRLEKDEIVFLLVVAPNKESIYPEFLPQGIQPIGSVGKLDQLLQDFDQHGGPSILDLRSILQEGKIQSLVYFHTDTHWNSYGAYLAYREILLNLESLLPELIPLPLDEFHEEQAKITGDLTQYLPTGIPSQEETLDLIPNQPRRASTMPGADERTLITEVSDPTLPKAVIFHDSFGNGLVPYLSEHFRRVNYQRRFDLDFELIEQEKPDVVIYEVAERYLRMLVEPSP